jgi:hypothetical protein
MPWNQPAVTTVILLHIAICKKIQILAHKIHSVDGTLVLKNNQKFAVSKKKQTPCI